MQEFWLKFKKTANDLAILTKPRITFLCLFMTLGGLGLAPGKLNLTLVFAVLLGTGMAVGAANTLNMYLEREGDKLMERTQTRPLADGRMNPNTALIFGLFLGTTSVALLWFFVNPLTAILALFAQLSYVLVYTPLKRVTPLALIIGAVPGAMPPLMGWTALTNGLEKPGIVLFLILLLWQVPHFIAISLYHKSDYLRAGIKTIPVVRGDVNAKIQAFAYSLTMIPITLLFIPLNFAGWIYGAAALIVGLWYAGLSFKGFFANADGPWARQFFLASLIYLPVLTFALWIDRLIL